MTFEAQTTTNENIVYMTGDMKGRCYETPSTQTKCRELKAHVIHVDCVRQNIANKKVCVPRTEECSRKGICEKLTHTLCDW